MNDLLDYYQQQAVKSGSTLPWLKAIQRHAISELGCLGLPNRHHEDWKYTSVDSFVKQRFHRREDKPSMSSVYQPDNASTAYYTIPLQDGIVVNMDGVNALQSFGVVVDSLSNALMSHPDKLKPFLNAIVPHLHGFQALNTAMLRDGVFIYLPEGIVIDKPIRLSHWATSADSATYIRHLVVAEVGSRVSIIEDFQGTDTVSYLTNTITEIQVHADAQVTHYKIQNESKSAFHFGHVGVKQSQGSQFESHSLSLGGKLVRSDISIDLCEPGARCLMNGIYAPGEGQHIDHHTLVNHFAPDCLSEQDYKGILTGHSRAVFDGQVMVATDAQHTIAKQQNKNLLLSQHAEIDTKPQLNIFADDVICTHGATVGQLDEEALFYLATRGVERATATEYLIRAFTVENFRALKNATLSDWMSTLLNLHLRRTTCP